MDYGLITFASTHGAISAQKALEPVAAVRVMPVLREISLGCGMALRFPPQALETVQRTLAGSELRPGEYALYAITGSGPALRAEPLPAHKA